MGAAALASVREAARGGISPEGELSWRATLGAGSDPGPGVLVSPGGKGPEPESARGVGVGVGGIRPNRMSAATGSILTEWLRFFQVQRRRLDWRGSPSNPCRNRAKGMVSLESSANLDRLKWPVRWGDRPRDLPHLDRFLVRPVRIVFLSGPTCLGMRCVDVCLRLRLGDVEMNLSDARADRLEDLGPDEPRRECVRDRRRNPIRWDSVPQRRGPAGIDLSKSPVAPRRQDRYRTVSKLLASRATDAEQGADTPDRDLVAGHLPDGTLASNLT